MNKNWYYPKKLKEFEKKVREGVEPANTGGDFGSYKIMLDSGDLEQSMIGCHNDLDPESKLLMIKAFIKRNMPLLEINSILNVGCGLGFETKALTNIFNCMCMGVDASIDGVNYAKKNNLNNKTKYLAATIDSDFLLDSKYDICFAREFYPFTRTKDIVFQQSIISSLFNNIKPGSPLILYQLFDQEESIKENILLIAKNLNKKVIVSERIIYRFYQIIPNFFLCNLFSIIYEQIFNKKISNRIIIFY